MLSDHNGTQLEITTEKHIRKINTWLKLIYRFNAMFIKISVKLLTGIDNKHRKNLFKKFTEKAQSRPDECGSVGRALFCKVEGHGLGHRSGHRPGLQGRSLVGGV